DQV
ncbi:hypothetical protein BN1708_019823, partial [Verticillium longisporum]